VQSLKKIKFVASKHENFQIIFASILEFILYSLMELISRLLSRKGKKVSTDWA
jgi:hypothetical protein